MRLAGWTAIAIGVAAAVTIATSPRSGGPSSDAVPSTAAAEVGALPSGPAVLVADGYQAPKDRVDSTGAFVPANGKPTLVWVEAIW